MVGAGLLSLPWALGQASVGAGIIAMLVMALLNGISLIVIARCCELCGKFSYMECGKACFGPWAGIAIQVVVGLYAFGSCVSYAILVGKCAFSKNAS